MKKLNIAVVGVGHIGSQHAKHAKNLGNLVAVCDIKETQAKMAELKEKRGKEFDALFKKIKEAQELIKYLHIKSSSGEEFWEAFPIVFSQSKELGQNNLSQLTGGMKFPGLPF